MTDSVPATRIRRRSSRIAPSNGEESFFQVPQGIKELRDSLHNDKVSYVPPWTEPYIIGVAGPSGSGKTSVASKIIKEINTPWTVLLSLDNFYKPLTPEQSKLAFQNKWDFDTPESIDLDLVYKCVKSLKEGRKTQIPVYSFAKHSRVEDQTITIYGANVIIVEGIYGLYHKGLNDLMQMKIYVDTDLDICLARRLNRDILYRGRDLEGALQQWSTFVKPNAERFVKPCMKNANLIVPKGSENVIAIDMLIKHIKKQLYLKSEAHLKHIDQLTDVLDLQNDKLTILPRTNQTHGIYTILLNKQTKRDDFIFYFDRIATTLINKALEFLDFQNVEIETPLNIKFNTKEPSQPVVAVNIIRSGDCFMHSLRKTLPEIAIGKLLIQSDITTGEPQLHSDTLPPKIASNNTRVLLLDAQIISGAAIIMAIQVLVDHGVDPGNITVVSYLATETGLSRILKAFKKVNVVVGEVGFRDKIQSETWFRKRFIDTDYFGT
ncbi:hypothetical protein BN7_2253 [Wickerhamomyces ciferrii]|uniref:Uridine kinase n=1 Tax=Wickerhamomyces ciferrii (strain ATCC 14091 / BCRC 22168 / CBS 111 / JCM 3599 / NBRC 0793 / NRRL Y-1031 F-60-10) TaxID=1206466 RepID=K0KMW7_WICCF|nr:uncharacterized protein BN7_2253 [Wickerhamomyces ciferrii]CCH42709.1 hypothetical protein BN7_2253 [Wickerhamomyces ciferrii]